MAQDERQKKRASGEWPREPTDEPQEEVEQLDDALVRLRYGEGDVIAGKYRLGRKLGGGGMGEVWLAHNETLEIDVAVKLIRADRERGESEDRLLREARTAARLGNPAIVRIFDFGTTENGDPFIVMELLAGEDLATALEQRGRLSAVKAVRTLLPIAHALAAAHAKGIVHRDLKPENIFLQVTEGNNVQPKLVDFGVAKLDRAKTLRLTQTGALLGSPLYMSPEQARGDDVDHRADIWSLCVVLYEMISGRPPFEGKNYNAVLYSIVANEPLPITQVAAGDEQLWEVVKTGLAKDPDQRWQSTRELGVALARWLQARGISEDITGASIDAAWLQRQSLHDGDSVKSPLASEPPAAPSSGIDRSAYAAVVETRRVARKKRSSRAWWFVAAAALSAAGGAAWFAWVRVVPGEEPAAEPVVHQPAPQNPETLATTPAATAAKAPAPVLDEPPIPVEALERAPATGGEEGRPAPAPQKRAVRPRPSTRAKAASGSTRPSGETTDEKPSKPAALLKDPFQ